MDTQHCQLLIIGGGPGGYVCAIRAGQLGLKTILVEAAHVGGTCLNVGCIPSKALIHAANAFHAQTAPNDLGIVSENVRIDTAQTQAWKNSIVAGLTQGVSGLLKRSNVTVMTGHATILDGKTVRADTQDGPCRITCDALVVATGARPTELSDLPFGGNVISSTEALSLSTVPKTLAVVGGGYIGLEIGTAMAKLGSNVTIVEASDRVLPQYDAALTRPVTARLSALGVDLRVSTKACGLSHSGDLEIEDHGSKSDIPADYILVAVGRTPVTQGFGLENLMLTMAGPYIAVDHVCATSMRGVFAIGDVTGDPMLAHRAMAQGVIVAEHVAGLASRWDKRAVPAVCFTDPELVVVGDLPSDDMATAVFPFAANGRALTMERTDGFVRAVYVPATEAITGLQAVGMGASELSGEFAVAIEMCATLR
ncbi:MAG: dihydrolipoyl dehydrogenase, partial [Pseudomonadota bacterium]